MKALVFAAALGAFALPASAALETVHFTEYSVTFDNSTVLGGISFNSGGSGGSLGFGWTLSTSLVANDATIEFALPSFTVTANSGYTLSGDLSGFIGNLGYTEIGNGESGAWLAGAMAIDGSPVLPFYELLDRTEQLGGPQARSGYYSLGGSAPLGSFSSLVVSGLTLTLSASANAVVSSVGQGRLEVGFVAAPVPEPETYTLMLAGLGLISLAARRRMAR
ncbi:PEP-CTERM sorting domain-containing protein [Methyloversatilis discipulorum]|uniref:PEP-CTERM sorting domain-containing protein n=1 Tax=Methyloversatilis discipulorum TaxID=1119528 RepID=UPI00036ADABE|nr:PEP-CTERM sorting domain-containing protein [Methyloversatilis discipulorum]